MTEFLDLKTLEVRWPQRGEAWRQAALREAQTALRETDRDKAWLAAVARARIGDCRGAIPLLEEAVRRHPVRPKPLRDLGMAQLADGDPEAALLSLRAAEAFAGDRATILEARARAEVTLGRFEEALATLERCREARRATTDAIRGHTLLALERLDEAEASLRAALEIAPGCGEALIGLGLLAERAGCQAEAEERYRAAQADAHAAAAAHCFLARLYSRAERTGRALNELLTALERSPDYRPARLELSALLQAMREVPCSGALLRALRDALRSQEISAQLLFSPCLHLLRQVPQSLEILEAAGNGTPTSPVAAAGAAGELLIELLQRALIADREIESSLVALRARLLANLDAGHPLAVDPDLAQAVACQALLGEFIWSHDGTEQERVARLAETLRETLDRQGPADDLEGPLTVFAMYRPLASLGEALRRRPRSSWTPGFAWLLRLQDGNRREELEIAAALDSWGSPEVRREETLGRVRAQYESHPYPTWTSFDRSRPQIAGRTLRQIFPHFEPPDFLQLPCRILVAGCGTGQHALATSRRFLASEIVAVDLSRRSLAYGRRMARELGIEGVSFRHGNLLRPPAGEEPYDLIECAGVLHHLPDPEAGWHRLCELLRPGGVIKVALYSSRAREGIRAARAVLEERGIGHDDIDIDGIRAARQVLFELDPGETASLPVSLFDFYNASGCVDLLFHVQEHTFDLAQIGRSLEQLGLRLLGFEALHDEAMKSYREVFPFDPRCTNLEYWTAFEKRFPLTFLRMYQFWCQKPI